MGEGRRKGGGREGIGRKEGWRERGGSKGIETGGGVKKKEEKQGE